MDAFTKQFEALKYNGKREEWKCHRCGYPGDKTDERNEVWCDQCIETSIKQQRKNIKVEGKQKIGRNQPCICGSEMKYKQCCLKKTNHG